MTDKVGHEFYVIMVKRRDNQVYCDLAKTNLKIYLNEEDAEKDLYNLSSYYGEGCYHIVKMVAYLDK